MRSTVAGYFLLASLIGTGAAGAAECPQDALVVSRTIVVDPRETPTAREADVHLAPRLGTNVALLNGLLHLIIRSGHADLDFLHRHTVGFEKLQQVLRRVPDAIRQLEERVTAKVKELDRPKPPPVPQQGANAVAQTATDTPT